MNTVVPDGLLRQAAAGDPRAADDVIAVVRPLVVRYCRARLGRLDVLDAVVQQVCLAVRASLPRYRTEARPFLAFVYGIASQKVTDALPAKVSDRRTSERHEARDELLNRLEALLDTLPDEQREVLVLRIVIGLSAQETAEAVGSTPGAVRVAQARALARLRVRDTGGRAALPDVIELLGDDEPLRRGYAAYVGALASALDLDAGLAHCEDRRGHREFVVGLAGRLNLDAGLEALLRGGEPD